MLKVFISYKTQSPQAEAAIARLRAELHVEIDEGRIDLFQDLWSIRCGDVWRQEIDRALRDCHVAVILLCPAALGSWWVQRELNVLTSRHAVPDDGLVILPILLGGVEAEALGADPAWSPSNLEALECVDPSRLPEIAGRLRDQLAAHPDSALGALMAQMDRAMAEVHDVYYLREALMALGVPAPPHAPAALRKMLVRHLFRADTLPFLGALEAIIQGCPEAARRCLDIYPFTWVPEATARSVLGVSQAAGRAALHPVIGLVGQEPHFTPRQLLKRALCVREPPQMLYVTGPLGLPGLENLKEQIIQASIDKGFVTPHSGWDKVKARLEQRAPGGHRKILVVVVDRADPALFLAAHEALREVVLLFVITRDPDAPRPAAGWVTVSPPIPQEAEEDACDRFVELSDRLGLTPPQRGSYAI